MNELCKQKIDEINRVVAYSQGIDLDTLDSTRIVEKWYKNKQKFINAFAGKTKITLPNTVIACLSEEDKKKTFDKFLQKLVKLDLLGSTINDYNFIDYLKVNYLGFYDNAVVCVPNKLANTPISEGMKLLKTFKYFFNNEEGLRAAQDAASLCIQSLKLKGKLTISVDPLDFLTSSENNNNWRSCHALDGDYRAGNFSYMCDEVTVIAYLESESQEQVQLKMFPEGMLWNNKKWRMLVHLHPEDKIWYFGRHYPNYVPSFDNEVCKMLNTALGTENMLERENIAIRTIYFGNNQNDCYNLNNIYFLADGQLINSHKMIKDGSSLHYNDILYSSVQMPRIAIGERPGVNEWAWNRYWEMSSLEDRKQMKMFIGTNVPCMVAGCEGEMDSSDNFGCRDCEVDSSRTRCAYCGRFIFEDEATYLSEYDDIICEECFLAMERRRTENNFEITNVEDLPF